MAWNIGVCGEEPRPIAGGNWAAPTIPTVPHPNGGI